MSLTDEILELTREYKSMKDMIDLRGPESQEIEFKPLYYPDLLKIRKDLSCLSIELAVETSKYMRMFKNLESTRKVQFFIKKRQNIEAGMKIGSAEAQAEVDVGDLRESESMNEGFYMTGRLILNQTNEILKSLGQDISIIKKEYESINNLT